MLPVLGLGNLALMRNRNISDKLKGVEIEGTIFSNSLRIELLIYLILQVKSDKPDSKIIFLMHCLHRNEISFLL